MEDITHPEEYYDVGETLPLRVIKIDPKNKRIVLSVGAYLKTQGEEDVTEFMSRHPKREVTRAASSSDDAAGLDDDLSDVEDDIESPAATESGGETPA